MLKRSGRPLYLGLLLAVMAAGCGGDKIRAAGADDLQEAKLAKGEILTSTTTDPLTKANLGIVTGVINLPPEKLWAILSDYDSFQKYMPFMKETQVVSSQDTTANVKVSWNNANIPISVLPISISYWSLLRIRTYPRTYYAEFQQLEGDMKRVEGTFLLEPFPKAGGSQSRIVISMIFQIGDILDLGARGFMDQLLPSFISNMRNYVKTIDPNLAEVKPWAQIPKVNMQESIDKLPENMQDMMR